MTVPSAYTSGFSRIADGQLALQRKDSGGQYRLWLQQ
jgi:hypothetical protein